MRNLLAGITIGVGVGLLAAAVLGGSSSAVAGGEPGLAAEGRESSGPGLAATGPPGSGPGSAPQPEAGLYAWLDPDWAADPLWDDGAAELALYSGTLVREFSPREDAYVATVVVKEAFTPEYLVKANDWRDPDAFDVLKLNHVSFARTGLYDFDQMVSAFVDRDRLVPIKMTYGSQDWCGQVFKEWRRWGDQRELFVSSYFDGQGTQRRALDLDDAAVPYDSLPVLLRALPLTDPDLRGRDLPFSLVPTLRDTRVGPLEPVEATLTIAAVETVSVPAGDFEAARLELRYPDDDEQVTETWWLETAYPNRPLRIVAGEEELRLQRSERTEYWRRSGDEVPWFPAPALD